MTAISFLHERAAPGALRPLAAAAAALALCLAAAPGARAEDKKESKETTLQTVVVQDQRQSAGPYASQVSVGGKEAVNPREVAHAVSVVTSERVRDAGAVTVTDALQMATGVAVISNDMHQSQFYSRGYSLNVSLDGVPVSGSLSGQQQLDMTVYERAEVLRGPAGEFSGMAGDNFGGTVNLVRKRARSAFGLQGSVSAGRWNNYHTELDVTGPLAQGGALRGRAALSMVDKDWYVARAHTRKPVAYGTLEWDMNAQTTFSLAAAWQRDKVTAGQSGLPAWTTGALMNVDRSTNVNPDWAYSIWEHRMVTADVEHRLGASGWQVTGRLTRHERDQLFHDGLAISGVNPQTRTLNYARRHGDTTDARNTADLFASGPFHLWGREHRALIGANWDDYSSTTYGYKWLRPWDRINDVPFGRPDLVPDLRVGPFESGSQSASRQYGLYGQLRLKASDPLTLVLGGRWSHWESRSRTIAPSPKPTDWVKSDAKASAHFTPSLAALYDLSPEWTVYASYSTMFQPYSNKRVDGSTLEPREGRQLELGAKAELLQGRLQLNAAIYDMRDVNRSQQDPDHPDFYINQGKVRSRGFDVEVTGRPAPGHEIQAGYTFQRSKYIKDKNNANLQWEFLEPRHNFKFWALRHFESGPVQGLSVGLGVNAYSRTSINGGAQARALRRQGGYAVTNLMLRYRINPHWSVQLNANNVFDRTYYTRLGGLNTYNTYGAPRNWLLTLRAQF